MAPIGRHSGPARPASKPAIAGSRTLPHQRTEGPSPDLPRVLGRGPPSSPPGPVPAQASSTAHPSPPGPIPTQARASATGGFEHWPTNGRVWISGRSNRVAKLDAAQYHMLLAMCSDQVVLSAPFEQILNRISESCQAQNDADLEFFVHWSRHLVAYLRQITGSELLIGASAVTYNPHFPYFSFPYSPDVQERHRNRQRRSMRGTILAI